MRHVDLHMFWIQTFFRLFGSSMFHGTAKKSRFISRPLFFFLFGFRLTCILCSIGFRFITASMEDEHDGFDGQSELAYLKMTDGNIQLYSSEIYKVWHTPPTYFLHHHFDSLLTFYLTRSKIIRKRYCSHHPLYIIVFSIFPSLLIFFTGLLI